MRSCKLPPASVTELESIRNLIRATEESRRRVIEDLLSTQMIPAYEQSIRNISAHMAHLAPVIEERKRQDERVAKELAELYSSVKAAFERGERVSHDALVAVRGLQNLAESANRIVSDRQATGAKTSEGVPEDPIAEPQPKYGERILYLLLSRKNREYVLGDLEEEYSDIVAKFGPGFARVWYRKQVLASITPMIGQRIVGLLKVISLVKAFEWLVRWIRS